VETGAKLGTPIHNQGISQAFSLHDLAAHLNPWCCHGLCYFRPLACGWDTEPGYCSSRTNSADTNRL